jgi:hypothetical protein
LHEPTSPTIVAPQVLLGNHLKALKLPTWPSYLPQSWFSYSRREPIRIMPRRLA